MNIHIPVTDSNILIIRSYERLFIRTNRLSLNAQTSLEAYFPSRDNDNILSVRHRIHTGCGAHPAYYPMGTSTSLPGGRTAGV